MEDIEVFNDEVPYSEPNFMDLVNQFVNEAPATPNGMNYQSARKLQANHCLESNDDEGCAFNLSEAVSATLRTMTLYRDKQIKSNEDKFYKYRQYMKPIQQDWVDENPLSEEERHVDQGLLEVYEDFLDKFNATQITEQLQVADELKVADELQVAEELPFHMQYLRFGPENNNIQNFRRILEELPKEWTIVQLTAPYNPNENLKSLEEYKTEINSINISLFANDYFDDCGLGPLTINLPANVTKETVKPLFKEFFSILDDNYKTIDTDQFIHSKKLVDTYWSRREEIDLRLKSALHVMHKEWLGAFGCLLTGKLLDRTLKDKIKTLVDNTITDWGFVKLTKKQIFLLYNLVECSFDYPKMLISLCLEKILLLYCNRDEIRRNLPAGCQANCSRDFTLITELCGKCLAHSFKKIHSFTLVESVKAFMEVVTEVKQNPKWAPLQKAKRSPVILIVDEMLDSFPWETLPILNYNPVSRMESIHFLYYLYKIHENSIVDGYLSAKCDVGRYVINPEQNLGRMEKRMSSFVNYWCEDWIGYIGKPPPAAEFLKYLVEADVFLYCGHGDGCQQGAGAAGGAGVEGGRGGRAVAILSGCGSVRLQRAPAAPPAAAHHHLHIAGCPMVVGMLWEVTDLEVDKVITTLVSLYVPSKAPKSWPAVGKTKWSQGIIDTNVEQKLPFRPQKDLLRAICMSRGCTKFLMIGSSIVARGLPIRIGDGKRGEESSGGASCFRNKH